jgi:hypothetical protein
MTKAELMSALREHDDDTEVVLMDVVPPDSGKFYEIADVTYDDIKDILVIELGDVVRHG